MENAGVQKKQAGESPSVARALWDPFGFMQDMFGWGRSGGGTLFEVKETDDTYVCKVKVNLTLPDQADVAHAKAELENGELTLVVPKAAAGMLAAQSSRPTAATAAAPEPESRSQATAAEAEEPESSQKTTARASEPQSSPRRTRRAKGGKGTGSEARAPRRATRTKSRRGR